MGDRGGPRRPPNPWVWVLAVALLALVAWSIGRAGSGGRHPEPEMGVLGDPAADGGETEQAAGAAPTPPPPAPRQPPSEEGRETRSAGVAAPSGDPSDASSGAAPATEQPALNR